MGYNELGQKSSICPESGSEGLVRFLAAAKFNRVPQLEINVENESSRLRSDFNTFLSTVMANLTERHEQEEMNIMNMRA